MPSTRSEGYTLSLNVILVEDPTQGGFTAFFKQFPYVIAEGENEDEAMKNLMNAMHDVVDHLSNNDVETHESNVKIIQKSVNFEAHEMA